MRRHRRVTGGVVRWVRDFAGRVAGLPSVACACALATRSFVDTARAAVGGRLCLPTLAQLWAASWRVHLERSTGVETCATPVVFSRARWPAHRFGVLLGSRGSLRGRPARVRRPAVGSPKVRRARELARLYKGTRGHGRAHRGGCWWVPSDMVCARVAFLVWERGGFGVRFILKSCFGVWEEGRACARAGGRSKRRQPQRRRGTEKRREEWVGWVRWGGWCMWGDLGREWDSLAPAGREVNRCCIPRVRGLTRG
jgi:hypothetical protein